MEVDGGGTPRRQTRAALAEIPPRLDQLRMTPLQNVLTPITIQNMMNESIPSSFLSPTASPDEQVIQQRGRRTLPATWSPDIDFKKNLTFRTSIRTPPKINPVASSPSKNLKHSLRSAPRKRLLLGDETPSYSPEKIDFSDISTPQKIKINSSPFKNSPSTSKRLKLEQVITYDGPLDLALKGLTQNQIIEIIKGLLIKHPELELEIRKNMPKPDLRPVEEKLNTLKCNIFKSLPSSRLISKTDSPAFTRVSLHVMAFKKYVTEQAKVLLESQHWASVLDYVFLAWSYVRATPVWDNHPHNAARRHCFKTLTSSCLMGLKKGTYDSQTLTDYIDKLQSMLADNEDIQSCIMFIQGKLNS